MRRGLCFDTVSGCLFTDSSQERTHETTPASRVRGLIKPENRTFPSAYNPVLLQPTSLLPASCRRCDLGQEVGVTARGMLSVVRCSVAFLQQQRRLGKWISQHLNANQITHTHTLPHRAREKKNTGPVGRGSSTTL